MTRVLRRRSFAPGRVNLIGDHTDYTGGLVLPMAVQLGTTVDVTVTGDRIRLLSESDPTPVDLPLAPTTAPAPGSGWARYVAAIMAECTQSVGIVGSVRSTLPLGAGLSSSASLEIALALALGWPDGDRRGLAQACQRAEHRATGVPCGIMDQLVIAEATAGNALALDCHSLVATPVPLPTEAAVFAVPSGVTRRLEESPYAERRAACEAAEATIGPLRLADVGDLAPLTGAPLRRARHVVTENARVREFTAALLRGDLDAAGTLMIESHRSLADDFEVSVPALDELVARLLRVPGVRGARLTGAGFGGCVVVLADQEVQAGRIGGWRLEPSGPASVSEWI